MTGAGGVGGEGRLATIFLQSAGECRAWRPPIRRLWEDIWKAQEWKHPRAPSGKWLWKEMSTEAVLAFLIDTRVGCIRVERRLLQDAGVRMGCGDEGEEGGPGPPGL